MKELLPYIIDRLDKYQLRYEIHSFDSGAMMIDVWKDGNFYVIQIDGNIIGLSLVTEETSFDIVPDWSFTDANTFKTEFERHFN